MTIKINKLIDKEEWFNQVGKKLHVICMECNRWATSIDNLPTSEYIWKNFDELDNEEKNEAIVAQKSLKNPISHGLCPKCKKKYMRDIEKIKQSSKNINWYKKAQKNNFDSYYDIGHNNNFVLWAFIDGRLIIHPKEFGDHTKWKNLHWYDYRGRFDPETKKCSIVNPHEFKDVPDVIIDSLYEKFGHDIEIVEFD
jgi:hypothetical protein